MRNRWSSLLKAPCRAGTLAACVFVCVCVCVRDRGQYWMCGACRWSPPYLRRDAACDGLRKVAACWRLNAGSGPAVEERGHLRRAGCSWLQRVSVRRPLSHPAPVPCKTARGRSCRNFWRALDIIADCVARAAALGHPELERAPGREEANDVQPKVYIQIYHSRL